MLKGSGLIRAYPRLNARVRRAASATSNGSAQTIFYLVWCSAGILCLVFVCTITSLLLALHIAFPKITADAFTPYQGVYPGLVLANMGPATCVSHTISQYTHEEECELRLSDPGADTFRKVTIAIHDGHIGKVSFQCSSLLVGNLVDQWGRPDEITRSIGGYLLRWSKKGITAQVRGSQWFNYQLPVENVILT